MLIYGLALLGIVTVSWLAVMGTRATALRWKFMDIPNDRSSHIRPVPIGGGIAVVAINLAAWGFSAFIHPIVNFQHFLPFIAGGALVAGISFLDDIGEVPIPIRFGAQGMAAALFIAGCGFFHAVTMPVLGTVTLGALGVVVTLVWIVGLTNAYNFIDGIDGMAGGQAVAAGVGWTALGLLTHHPTVTALGAMLGATSLGFLVHNWHPATIFMGDVGATFLGFSFAAITVIAAQDDPKLALAGALLVWPAIFDSGFTILRRLRNHESIFAGHRSFLFHRLIASGWSHSAAAMLYIPLPILGAVLAYTWDRGNPYLHGMVVLSIGVACFSLWLLVRTQERRAAVDAHRAMTEALLEGAEAARAVATMDVVEEEGIRAG